MARKTFINPPEIYGSTWQFNQAIRVSGGDLLFISGIVGLDSDGNIVSDDIVSQAKAAFENLSAVMRSAGGSLADIIKVNIYLSESYNERRDELRELRALYFTSDFPVSTLVQVAGFANPEYLFEIEAMAVLDND